LDLDPILSHGDLAELDRAVGPCFACDAEGFFQG
jgi:hypothetical protein